MIATKPSQAQRILRRLQEEGSLTNVQMNQMGIYRYAARIQELRKLGHRIESIHEKGGLWRFKYSSNATSDANSYAAWQASVTAEKETPQETARQLSLMMEETAFDRINDGRGITG